MTAIALDHVGVVVRDLDVAAHAWQALGFQVTPLAPHLPAGITGNRCVMFGHGYIELIAVIAPEGHSATLEKFLARYEGIHIISLATANADATAQRLGLTVIRSERETARGTARFARVVCADLVPRLQLLEHLTPDLVWLPKQAIHPNHARALRSVVIASDNPGGLARHFADAAGVAPAADGAGLRLPLDHAAVRILPDLASVFPRTIVPSLAFVAGIEVATDDDARVGQIVEASGVAIRFVA